MERAMIDLLRRINRGVALAVGLGLMGCAGFVLLDIVTRQLGRSFGGTEEIAGYAMALATSWGMGFALIELAHVRIDLLRSQTRGALRALFDLGAMAVMAAVVTAIAIKAWPVVERSITQGTTANTPLATPQAWIQVPWFAGWVWFALMTCLLTLACLALILRGRGHETETFAGAFAEVDSLK